MGVVYEAHDTVIDRKVAIKLIRTDLLEGGEREDYVERFRREAQAAGRCNHPCVVTIFDYAVHDGSPFLVMEYVDGLGLDRVLAEGERFAPAAAVHIILQLLEGLSCAHSLGIVHRDIKPANLLLLKGGRVKITDFGIARLDRSNLTQVGMTIGTPSYMSPEQCYGAEVDARSDLFSAATVFQELLTGERPFPGRHLNDVASSLLRDAPSGGGVEAIAGPALRAVLERALAKRPEDRYEDAGAMAQALRDAVGAQAPEATPGEAIDQTMHTVIANRALRSSLAPISGEKGFDQGLLGTIERKLAERVGPIARYLMQTSLSGADSIEALCDSLARRIDRPEDRRGFLTEAMAAVRTGTMASASAAVASSQLAPASQPERSSSIPLEEIERARRALSDTQGPIAKVLVQRALKQADSPQDLWNRLASHIDSAADRSRFLEQRKKG